MGSLMSGWSSSVLSDREVRLMRNRSLTKDEVAAFWRQHGTPGSASSGEASAGSSPVAGSPRAGLQQQVPLAARRLEASRSMPPLRSPRGEDHLYGDGGRRLFSSRSSVSEPATPAAAATRVDRCFFPDEEEENGATAGWWTRSSWAFLNEPPKEEVLLGRAQTCFACDQFHAARIVTGNA